MVVFKKGLPHMLVLQLTAAFVLLLATDTYASDARQRIREGNRLFEEGNYAEAEAKYRQSLEAESNNYKALFNLGNTLYRQGRLEEARQVFDMLSYQAPSETEQANVLHNLGNAYLGAGQLAESIEAYKQALRLRPEDEDTRYNLAYALNLLDEMPPQEEPEAGDSQEDQDEDPEEGMHEEQAPGTAPEDTGPDRMEQLSHEDAEKILDALKQQEQKIQEQINREDHTKETVRTQREW